MSGYLCCVLGGLVIGCVVMICVQKYRSLISEDKQRDLERKLYEFYFLLTKWMMAREKDKTIGDYLENNSIKTIAIYGMKELGEILLEELKRSNVKVLYIIDKSADSIFADIKIVTPENELEAVDAVIVTAVHYYDEIKNDLSTKLSCPIISLRDLVNIM